MEHEVYIYNLRTPEADQEDWRSLRLYEETLTQKERGKGGTSDNLMFLPPEAALSGTDKQLT